MTPSKTPSEYSPIESLNLENFNPDPREVIMIERSRRLAVRNTSRQPRSLKDFQEQFARIQGARQQ